MLSKLGMWRHRTSLGYFGAESAKPVYLYCTYPFIAEVDQYRTASQVTSCEGVATKTVNNAGEVRVNGGPRLKETQAYPPGFGTGMAKLYSKHQASILKQAELLKARDGAGQNTGNIKTVMDLLCPAESFWEDTQLQPVFSIVQRMVLRRMQGGRSST